MQHHERLARPPLRFRLGEYALWIWRPRLISIDCSGSSQIDWSQLREDALESGVDGYYCRGLATGSCTPGVRREAGWLVYAQRQEKAFHIDLRGSFDDYLRKFNAKRRNDLKRTIRPFLQGGGSCPLWVAKRPEEMEEFQRRAVEISRETYQEKLFRAGMPDSAEYLSKMELIASSGAARGYLLRYEGKPVAYAWCAGSGRQLQCLVIGYLPQYARLSPGTALLYLLLENLFREGVFEVFSLGTGAAWYKEYFSTGSRTFVDLIVLRPSVRNAVLARLHALAEKVNDGVAGALERWGLKRVIKRILRRLAGVREDGT